jgi:hypothetical protein
MAKTKKQEQPEGNAPQQEEQKVPIGFTAKTDKSAVVTFQQFFDLMKILDNMNNVINFIKQENFNADNIRYYFPEDLTDAKDEQGNPILNKEGKPQKVLREDFWN